MALLDPKNDSVFKRLFVEAPELLAGQINAVRCAEAPIEVNGIRLAFRPCLAVVLDPKMDLVK